MRVVFFGTPEFAVPSLEALLGEGFDVLAAVTQPDRPQGRSRSHTVPSPVKQAAQADEVPVLQPERPTDPAFMQTFRALAPDVGVVVGYGHILKPDLLAIPARGMVNVHPSLLPELRGAAPIEWAIINGLTHTGVSIMKMDSGMDSGPILHAIREELPPDITGGELSAHLSELGAEALVEALMLLEQEAVRPRAQDHARATYAPKLTRETAHIDWTLAAERVARLIRGLDPRPGAWSTLDGQAVKLFGAVADGGRGGVPGEVLQADSRLCIATQDGTVAVEEVQAEGKARMPVAEWVRGRGARVGARFQ